MTDPILKWAGGKRQLLTSLYNHFPTSFNRYHEPFLGGGALFFDLEPDRGSINDANTRLINFYEQVRDRPENLIDHLRSFDDPTSKPDVNNRFSDRSRKDKEISSYYYQQRELYNNRPYGDEYDETKEAALLLYLNRTCYNGLYRENSDGGFNVPIGRYENPDWVRATEIRNASQVLESISIRNKDFEYISESAQEGDLVYFDPPYEPMSPTASFTDYSAAGFDKSDQSRLLDLAKDLDDRNIHVIISNSGVTYEMYNQFDFYVSREGATRSINSDGSNRDAVDEIVATNIAPDNRRQVGQQGLAEFQ